MGQGTMTERQTAEILLELRRIGVNLTTLSEPLVGTGLRASEMRDRVAEFTFHFFGPFLAPSVHIDPVTQATEMIASAERDHLALRPSPERHRRYLATRLRELVERYPVPPAKEISARQPVVVVGDAVGPPPLDPEGVCARCHAFRTVACVTMQTEPPTSVRFCASCWREVRNQYVGGRRGRPSSVTERIVAFVRQYAHRPRHD